MKEGVIILIAIGILCLIVFGVTKIKETECAIRAEDMNFPHKFNVIGGCRIKTPQGWIPMENYRQEDRR